MHIYHKCFINACQDQNIDYSIKHKDEIVLNIKLKNFSFFVIRNKCGLNRHDMSMIAKDKDISYELLKDHVAIPKWTAYLNPNCGEKYQDYVKYQSKEKIFDAIINDHSFPLIIKPNKGSLGRHVQLCRDKNDVKRSIDIIFNKEQRHYDYILIAQEYIKRKKEYRAVTYNNKILILYEKNTLNASFDGNMSPLHWTDSTAINITDKKTVDRIQNFLTPIKNIIPITFCGYDVLEDENDDLWLLELNSEPGLSIFNRDNGPHNITNMFSYILKDLANKKNLSHG